MPDLNVQSEFKIEMSASNWAGRRTLIGSGSSLSNVRRPESETVYGSVLAEILSSVLALVESSFGDPLAVILQDHKRD